MPSIEHDHMIEAFAPNGSNQPFDDAVLPWARGGGHDLLDVETRQLLVHCPAVHSIAITDEVTRGIPIGEPPQPVVGPSIPLWGAR